MPLLLNDLGDQGKKSNETTLKVTFKFIKYFSVFLSYPITKNVIFPPLFEQ